MNEKYFATKDLASRLANYPDYKDQIKILREALGMTQEQLAEKVDRTPRSIRQVENGEAFPRLTTLEKIAAALNAELKVSLIPKEDISGFLDKNMEQKEDNAGPTFEIQPPANDNSDFLIGETD